MGAPLFLITFSRYNTPTMETALWTLFVSGSLLLVFGTLFQVETSRDDRLFLGMLREWFDERLAGLGRWFSHLSLHFGSGYIRILFHFLTHRVLDWLLKALKAFQSSLKQLQKRNKVKANTIREAQKKNHLDLIAEHKISTALTPAEKQELKDRSIGV